MTEYQDGINRHYGNFDLPARILDKLRSAGKDPEALTREDLAPFDEFHTGGRTSTRELSGLAGLRPGMQVLDLGSGIGGPARTLAAEFGAIVTGLDLTEEFCRAATMLTKLVGLADSVTFRHGNALDMPFPDQTFDVAWSQNTIMNIAGKEQLFREVHRVLRPGGVLALEAVFSGRMQGTIYPTFWASSDAINFLVPADEARSVLTQSGFAEEIWEDTTVPTLKAAQQRHAPTPVSGLPALGRDVIVMREVEKKIQNAVRNLEDGRIVTARGVFRRLP